MPVLDCDISEATLSSIAWEQVLDGYDWTTERYSAISRLYDHLEGLPQSATSEERAVLRLVGMAISLRLNPNTNRPFLHCSQGPDEQSAGIDDLDERDINCLGMLAEAAMSPWIRARFADIACVAGEQIGMRTWRFGALAARAYFDYASATLQGDHAVAAVKPVQRGLELSWRYAKSDSALRDAYWDMVERAVVESLERRHLGIAIPLVQEIIDRRRDMAISAAQIVEGAAEQMSVQLPSADYDSASRCYRLAAQLWALARESAAAQRCNIASGEALIARSRTGGMAMLRADWLSEGIAILRRHKGDRRRIVELQAELADTRRHIVDEMQVIEYPIDTEEMVRHVKDRITGPKSFDALLQMAFDIASWTPADRVREDVLDSSQRSVFDRFVGSVTYDEAGVPVTRADPFDETDDEQVYSKMVRRLRDIDHQLLGNIMLPAAADAMYNGLEPSLNLIMEVVHRSPSVPRGHEISISRGLMAGFAKDWHEVGTYLIPMVEAFVRSAFKRASINTLVVRDDGGEDEKSLNELLSHPDAGDVLPKSLILELEALMTHRDGHNLRNRFCHGLMTDAMLPCTGVVVLWWTMWRLVLMPFDRQRRQRTRIENEAIAE